VLTRARQRLARFALEPASPEPLAFLRVGIAVTLIGEAAVLAPYLFDYYSSLGLVQAPVADALGRRGLPSIAAAAHLLGLTEVVAVRLAFAAYVIALHLLLVGVWTRGAAIASFVLFLMLKRAGAASAYGAFEFAHIALFYCAVAPVGGAFSLQRPRRPPSPGARLGLRVLQLHLCVVYLSSGITKALGEQWWNGEAMWRALMRPGHVWIDFSWVASFPLAAKIACWATLLCEIGYAAFVWIRPVRPFWISAVVALHVGIAVALGLVFFSTVMIVLNLSAFGVAAEPAPVTRGSAAAGAAGNVDRLAADPRMAPP